MDAAVRSTFASPLEDQPLREKLEALAQQPRFAEFTWFWGPALAERNRVLFRPFILSNFSSFAMNAEGGMFDAWQGETARGLARWLEAADAADDVELTRRLYGWRLQQMPYKKREAAWREEVVRRFSSAPAPAARFTALAKVDTGWMSLDARTAGQLYGIDRRASRAFILAHLPWFGWGTENRRNWDELLERSRGEDPEFHFDLYRRIVEESRWRTDVLDVSRSVRDPATLDAELERRHPRGQFGATAEIFHELVRARGRDVGPYILRHVASVFPRRGLIARREAKGLPALLATANAEGWLDLWAALLRTAATRELFNAEVKRLVLSAELPLEDVRHRLLSIAGHGREANLPGISFAQVHPLEEDVALALYRRFPDLVRGAYRMHVGPGWHSAYPKLAAAAMDAGDSDLVDFLASRAGMQTLPRGEARGWAETISSLTAHFEALPDEEFVRRAASALSRMPAFAIWNYDDLLRGNRLARLLFERSTTLYLSSGGAVRDLLESPQIHVQALAFRILGRDDPRARDIAAENADLLQATLFRPLHRRTRLLAFQALESAASRDEATGRYLLGRMREALILPEKRYPAEKLVGLIARVLSRWPSLRTPDEQPLIYGEVSA